MDSRRKVKLVKRRRQISRSRLQAEPETDNDESGDSIVALLINEFGGCEIDSDGNRLPPKGPLCHLENSN